MQEIHESAVRDDPGGTTVPVRVLNQDQERALVLIEGDGAHLSRGDVVTVDTRDLNTPEPGCVFCAIVAGTAPAAVVREWPHALAIRPRHPVVPGHVLVLPRVHVADAGVDRDVTARTAAAAAELLVEHGDANLITSRGAAATQTVFHLHMHVVPRTVGDGLPLPWTPQQEAARTAAAGGTQ